MNLEISFRNHESRNLIIIIGYGETYSQCGKGGGSDVYGPGGIGGMNNGAGSGGGNGGGFTSPYHPPQRR